jgi:hypothetical protein
LQESKFYPIIDTVASEFQRALDASRNDLTKLESEHVRQISELNQKFESVVDAKVSQQTNILLAELYRLESLVQMLRLSTVKFGNYAVMNGQVLDLVKLVYTLPYLATRAQVASDETRPLKDIKQNLARKDEFASTLLDSMPQQVDSNDSIRSLYLNIKPRLYQISLVPNDGGLVSYIISRLLTPFMFTISSSSSSSSSSDVGNEIELVDKYIRQDRLIEALDSAVLLSEKGWNSVVLDGFIDRLRSRVEFDVGMMALEAHLALVSNRAIIPLN